MILKPLKTFIKIGGRVGVGVKVTIFFGVTIGDDVVTGAESLVVKVAQRLHCLQIKARFKSRKFNQSMILICPIILLKR